MNPKARSALVRQVEWWGDAFPPACACGCHEPVRFSERKGPNKYVNTAHASWARWKVPGKRFGHIHGEVISTEDFRRAVMKLRDERGWTMAEMAVKSGWSPGRLRGVVYGGYPYILKSTARTFFRRLAGYSTPPTPWERRQQEQMTRAGKRAAAEIQFTHLRGRS